MNTMHEHDQSPESARDAGADAHAGAGGEGKAAYDARKRARDAAREEERARARRSARVRAVARRAVRVAVVGLGAGALVWALASAPSLPPDTSRGHTEDNPSSHVLREPMPESVQRHMLEHADGTGKPGVIIQYNCIDYSCEATLVERLEEFADLFPDTVYVAPSRYDGKIILTREGARTVLDAFDENVITTFIRRE